MPKLNSKVHALVLFLQTLDEVSLSEPRPINQTRWADELGITQSELGKALEAMVNVGLYVPGPKEGTANTYRVNPAFPGIQNVRRGILT